ncbi:MAG: hypothetical protein H7Z40_12025 [Phycisphaerae bacterium]|nr:hypothetical protein [Gemmatimonadaceae bacterium]
MNLRTLRLLDVLSATLFVLAAAVYLWPVSLTAPSTTPRTDARLPTVVREVDNADHVQQVITANILSASRRAPERRYLSPSLASETDFSMPAAFAPVTDSTSAAALAQDSDDAVPALYGTVNTDGVWRALLRLSGNDVNPSLFREGDKRGGYRVVSIRSNAVVVAGPAGQRTLRLAQPAPGDSIRKSL